MRTSEFYVPSGDGKELFARIWKHDDKSPKATVLIIHGMLEHSERYERFAKTLTENDYTVITFDLRGHGKSDPDQLGIIDIHDGFHHLVNDISMIRNEIEKEYSNLPFFFFSHSMGSFLTQRYMQLFDDRPTGIIYSGSNGKPPNVVYGGLFLSKIISKLKSPDFKSRLIHKMSFDPFNSKFKPNRTEQDWLSRDQEEVDKYISDPFCGFIPSVAFYYQLFSGLLTLNRYNPFAGKNPETSIFIISGDHDPVSNMGKGIKQLEIQLRESGAKNLTVKLYKEARHELLNEINREEVMGDVIHWMENRYNEHRINTKGVKRE